MKHLGIAALAAATLAVPGAGVAGSYGSAGVRDATVTPPATATASVWCAKVKAEVPVALASEMDCGEAVAVGTAKPKVARERFTTGLFGLPPHQRIGGTVGNDDDDPPIVPVSNSPDPSPTPPSTPPSNSGPVDKWTRLGQLGVDQSNYHQQGQGFIDKVDAYRNTNGSGGDWTNFQP